MKVKEAKYPIAKKAKESMMKETRTMKFKEFNKESMTKKAKKPNIKEAKYHMTRRPQMIR